MPRTLTSRELSDLAAEVIRSCGIQPANNQAKTVPAQRMVRYYMANGLLSKPTGNGRELRFGRRHLLELIAIKRMQSTGTSLSDVRKALDGMGAQELERVAAVPWHFYGDLSDDSGGAHDGVLHGQAALRTARSAAPFWKAGAGRAPVSSASHPNNTGSGLNDAPAPLAGSTRGGPQVRATDLGDWRRQHGAVGSGGAGGQGPSVARTGPVDAGPVGTSAVGACSASVISLGPGLTLTATGAVVELGPDVLAELGVLGARLAGLLYGAGPTGDSGTSSQEPHGQDACTEITAKVVPSPAGPAQTNRGPAAEVTNVQTVASSSATGKKETTL